MAQKTITLAVVRDARTYGDGTGAGSSDYLPVGLWGSHSYRSFIWFQMPNWTTLKIVRVISATMKMKTSTQFYVGRGSSPRMLLDRVTQAWLEGTANALSASNAITWDNMPNVTTAEEVDSGTMSTTDGAWESFGITTMLRKWAPSSVEGGGGQANYGLRMISYDPTSLSRTDEFFSSDSSYSPYVTLVYEDNTAPSAPINLTPKTNDDDTAAIATFVAGTKNVRFGMTRVDPDTGDYITSARVQIYADAATDAVPGTALVDTTKTFTGSPTAVTMDVDCSALTVGTTYRARVRTADKDAAWGGATSLLAMRFIPDTAPGAPSNLAVDVATQTPNFYGSLVDADSGASIGTVRILVYQDTTSGAILKWDSGFATVGGGTRFSVSYGGSTLDFGTKYRFAAQIEDNIGARGPLSSYLSWTPVEATGPDNMTPRTIETKQNTRTPVLTIAHSVSFDAYELEVARYSDPLPADYLWDVPATTMTSATSKAVTYAGLALDWGRTFFWRAKIRVGGVTWGDWSAWVPFYINALPNKPVGSVDNAVGSGTGPYGAYATVASTTPTLRFPFTDPDRVKGYTDNPVRREIEIVRADTLAAISGSPFVITSGITDTYTTAALTAGVTYKARARYQDSASQYSAWSDYVVWKVAVIPTIAAVGTVDATDPTPTLDWSFSTTQRRFRVTITISATGELVHDSGLIESSTTEYVVPGGVLDTGKTYRWSVTAYDVDLLSATLA